MQTSNKQRKTIYAFIDSQNLNLGVNNDIHNKTGKLIYKGWKLDFSKFRKFLTDRYRVTKAYIFIGMIEGNEELYQALTNYGYELIYKPTLEQTVKDVKITKGNVDAELVVYSSARLFNEYDKAVIVSGDGDFYCLYEYLIEKEKLEKILIPTRKRYSSLLRKFSPYLDFVSDKKKKLEYKKQNGEHSPRGRTVQGSSPS